MIFVIILELRCDLDLLDEAGDHHCICRSPTPDLEIVIIVFIMIIITIIMIIIILFVIFLIPGQRRYREQRQVSPEEEKHHDNRNMMPNMMVMVMIKMKMMKIVYLTFNTEMIMSTQYSAGARSSLAGSLRQDHDDDHGHHDHYWDDHHHDHFVIIVWITSGNLGTGILPPSPRRPPGKVS